MEYNFFHVGEFDTGIALQALAESIPNVDMARLNETYCRSIDQNNFFGAWYDPKTGSLVNRGAWTLNDGSVATDPSFSALSRTSLVGGGYKLPEIYQAGNYAYAFSKPPYGLRAKTYVIQELFEKINEIIFPQGCETEILDWCHNDLDKVSDYFTAGKEWWGMYLFTLYTRDRSQLIVISASTTD